MLMLTKDSIVVGVDVHKYAHLAVALNCLGQELSTASFSNDELATCFSWLESLGNKKQVIVALEDVYGAGVHLADGLQKQGFAVHYVPAVLTDRSRKHSVQKDKSDYLDAKRVGKVILAGSEETLPAAVIVSQERKVSRMLDLLVQERGELVREQTGLKNQLHSLLHQYYGNSYRQKFANIFTHQAIRWYIRQLECDQVIDDTAKTYVRGSILRRIKRLGLIGEQITDINKSLNKQSKTTVHVQVLVENLRGCGRLTACKIIAEIGTIKRFSTKAKFAKYAGIAPIQKGSAGKNRYYTNPYGNRKLNRAIHTIALTQIANHGLVKGKEYYKKKLNEGKSKLWALRCLKRHICNKIFDILQKEEKVVS
jgi:transposase